MADTRHYEGTDKCEDCNEQEAYFVHWGPLVPNGTPRKLCPVCIKSREEYLNTHGKPKVMGGHEHGCCQH